MLWLLKWMISIIILHLIFWCLCILLVRELDAILFKVVGLSRTSQRIVIRNGKILGILGLTSWVFERTLEVTYLTLIAKKGICPTVIPALVRYQTYHVYSLCLGYPFAQAPPDKFLLMLQTLLLILYLVFISPLMCVSIYMSTFLPC